MIAAVRKEEDSRRSALGALPHRFMGVQSLQVGTVGWGYWLCTGFAVRVCRGSEELQLPTSL